MDEWRPSERIDTEPERRAAVNFKMVRVVFERTETRATRAAVFEWGMCHLVCEGDPVLRGFPAAIPGPAAHPQRKPPDLLVTS
jgi:hypothetical protein